MNETIPQEKIEKARQLNAFLVRSTDGVLEMVDVQIIEEFMSDVELLGQSTLFNTPQDIARSCVIVPLFAALFFRGSLAFVIRHGHPAQWRNTAKEDRDAIATAMEQMGGFENLEEMSLNELAAAAGAELVRLEERLLTFQGNEEKKIIVARKEKDGVFRKASELFVSEKGVVRV